MFSNSQLIVKQVQEEYEAKRDNMLKYLVEVTLLTRQFDSIQMQRVPRFENKRADDFLKLASSSYNKLSKTAFVEVLTESSYKSRPVYPIHYQQNR